MKRQLDGGAGFAVKPVDVVRIIGEAVVQYLNSYRLIKRQEGGQIDPCHAAGAEFALYFVFTEEFLGNMFHVLQVSFPVQRRLFSGHKIIIHHSLPPENPQKQRFSRHDVIEFSFN